MRDRNRIDLVDNLNLQQLPADKAAVCVPRLDHHAVDAGCGERGVRRASQRVPRLAVTVSRRIPVLGGVVGMSVDGYTTWQIGRYADRELLPLAKR